MANSKLLVDFDAARGDDPSVIGQRNLEEKPDHKSYIKENTTDLYFKKDKDWQGHPAGHAHHKKGFVRAEYHSLANKTKSGETYYIGYHFALNKLPTVGSMIVFQWKEYEGNNAKDGGGNIPLQLATSPNKTLQFKHEGKWAVGGEIEWEGPIQARKPITVGLEIVASHNGTARLWLDGKPATMTGGVGKGTTTVNGNMYPKNSSAKFGAYGAIDEVVDTYVYKVQIGSRKEDLDAMFFGH
ncbi:hypothetical protein diail_8729 [Diaporthe ilicicola]|nr:hypothetical protein diail_8729 [Diaporthe ilicicola]